MRKDAHTAVNIGSNIDEQLPHYVIVFPEGEQRRVIPLCSFNDDINVIFNRAVNNGLYIHRDQGLIEWINIGNKDWAFVNLIEPNREE